MCVQASPAANALCYSGTNSVDCFEDDVQVWVKNVQVSQKYAYKIVPKYLYQSVRILFYVINCKIRRSRHLCKPLQNNVAKTLRLIFENN